MKKIKGNKNILLIHEIVVDNQKHVTATEQNKKRGWIHFAVTSVEMKLQEQ